MDRLRHREWRLSAANARFLLSFSLVLLVVVLTEGQPVPSHNESVYLLQLRRAWDSGFLVGDWTFENAGDEHWLFNHVFGAATLVFPLEVVAWLGRVICWSLCALMLFRIGQSLGLRSLAIALCVCAWILTGQSLVAHSWVFGGFEAKSVSYVLYLAAIYRAIRQQEIVAGLFAGLAFSFHPAVGALGWLSLVCGMAIARRGIRNILRFGIASAVGAIPGLLLTVGVLFAELTGESSQAALSYLVHVRMPHHLDALSWSRESIVALVAAAVFNIAWAWELRRSPLWRSVIGFQIGLAAPFAIGYVAQAVGAYGLLVYTPFRLFPLLTPLLFFFSLASVVRRSEHRRVIRRLMPIAVLFIASIPGIIGGMHENALVTVNAWRKAPTNLHVALAWSSESLPRDAQILVAPWDRDVWYHLQRPVVVNHVYFPYSDLGEWLERSHDVYGTPPRAVAWPRRADTIRENFERLTEGEIRDLQGSYQVDYIVTRTEYPFPVVHRSGDVVVYSVTTEDGEPGID